MQGTVLIVDDQIDLSGFLARLIKAEGFEVHTAPTGAEARRLPRSASVVRECTE